MYYNYLLYSVYYYREKEEVFAVFIAEGSHGLCLLFSTFFGSFMWVSRKWAVLELENYFFSHFCGKIYYVHRQHTVTTIRKNLLWIYGFEDLRTKINFASFLFSKGEKINQEIDLRTFPKENQKLNEAKQIQREDEKLQNGSYYYIISNRILIKNPLH